VARILVDSERERRAWERLERRETWDGLLPEAYDETTGAVASRHWFAWPAALRALLLLDPMLKAP
jgi:meiotically up-regulated gene 157 (Mug157) protein